MSWPTTSVARQAEPRTTISSVWPAPAGRSRTASRPPRPRSARPLPGPPLRRLVPQRGGEGRRAARAAARERGPPPATLRARPDPTADVQQRERPVEHILSIRPQWSDRRLAAITGVAPRTVAEARQVWVTMPNWRGRLVRVCGLLPVSASRSSGSSGRSASNRHEPYDDALRAQGSPDTGA